MKNFLFKNFVLLLSFMSLLCFSCSHYSSTFYSPDEGNTLGLREKGDLHASGSLLSGLSSQVGYSPIKHLGIYTSYSYMSGKNFESEFQLERYKHHLWNGAIGGYYFLPPIFKERIYHKLGFKKSSKGKDLLMKRGHLFESYVGYSSGKVFNYYEEGGLSKVRFRKPYVHFGWHRINSKRTFSWTYRYSHLNIFSVKTKREITQFNRNKLEMFEVNNNFPLHETTVRIDFGERKVRFYGSVTSFFSTPDLSDIGLDFVNVSIGFIFEIDEYRKAKKAKKN